MSEDAAPAASAESTESSPAESNQEPRQEATSQTGSAASSDEGAGGSRHSSPDKPAADSRPSEKDGDDKDAAQDKTPNRQAKPKVEQLQKDLSSLSPTDLQKLLKGTRHRTKVDGQWIEVDYDEALRLASHGTAANKRMHDAAERAKEAEPLIQAVQKMKQGDKSGWYDLVARIGVERAAEFAEDLLDETVKWHDMTPEQKRLAQLEHNEAQRQREAEAQEQKAAEARKKELADQAAQELDSQMSDALQALGRKPTPRIVARICERLSDDLDRQEAELKQRGIPAEEIHQYLRPLKPHDITQHVNRETRMDLAEFVATAPTEERQQLVRETLNGIPPEDIVQSLPKETLEVLRKHFIEAALAQDPLRSGNRATSAANPPKRPAKDVARTTDDWFQKIEKRLGG